MKKWSEIADDIREKETDCSDITWCKIRNSCGEGVWELTNVYLARDNALGIHGVLDVRFSMFRLDFS